MTKTAVLSPETHSAADIIRLLALEPLPREGGWFRRVAAAEDATRMREARPTWSSIYALFTPDNFSALHCLPSDEIWCFHAGDPLDSLRLYRDGRGERVRLGCDPDAAERAQDVVRAGTWQGTRLQAGGRWALVSCVVVPEFTWEGFQLGVRAELIRHYSEWADEIQALTRREH